MVYELISGTYFAWGAGTVSIIQKSVSVFWFYFSILASFCLAVFFFLLGMKNQRFHKGIKG
jgi:TRAP-type C4-dicarboxylate transport system permease small subunit